MQAHIEQQNLTMYSVVAWFKIRANLSAQVQGKQYMQSRGEQLGTPVKSNITDVTAQSYGEQHNRVLNNTAACAQHSRILHSTAVY